MRTLHTLTIPALLLSAAALAAPPPVSLDPSRGSAIGLTYEAFLSPAQEPGEEADTPKSVPAAFRSTTPSVTRAERVKAGHRGHAVVRFSADLSRAYVDVAVEGVKADEVNMFHIHCGRPGVLGPILIDLANSTDLKADLADGVLTVELTNADIAAVKDHGHGVVGAFTAGCVTPSPTLDGTVPDRVSTIAGMATIAAEGELYFNLHTTGQTYYGDMRGQIRAARGE